MHVALKKQLFWLFESSHICFSSFTAKMSQIWKRVQIEPPLLRGHRKSSPKPSDTKNCLGEWGCRKNRTSGFKWCFVYTLDWELKPEVRTFVRFGRGGGVQVKLTLFVLLGFCEILRCALNQRTPGKKAEEKKEKDFLLQAFLVQFKLRQL